MNILTKYDEAVGYIEGLSDLYRKHNYMVDRSSPEIYLKRMRYFLNLIGNPDRGLNFIHITGTSGKGTVTNMIHEVIFASGEKVGSFTSPYVTTSIEKIKIGDKYISSSEFIKIVNYLKPYIEESYKSGPYGGISYFEVFLSIALMAFKMNHCGWIVLEVGLGGRYDATNVIMKPRITAITNIDYDHTELLGKTLQKIALDKAGIIKRGSAFFTTESRTSLLKTFKKVCLNKKVHMTKVLNSLDYMENNKSLTRAIAKEIGIKDTFINVGINKARLQCRFEIIDINPLIVIDGAHNRAKIKSTIDNFKKLKFNKLHLIIAISENKDHISILKQIIPYADYLYITKFKNRFRKSADPKFLAIMSKEFISEKTRIRVCNESSMALKLAKFKAKNNDIILITGSFFLAGELRKHWVSEEWILKNRKSFK